MAQEFSVGFNLQLRLGNNNSSFVEIRRYFSRNDSSDHSTRRCASDNPPLLKFISELAKFKQTFSVYQYAQQP